jgi:hypothetical protein
VGFPWQPRRRRRGARRREVSRRGGRSSSGPAAAAGEEEATGAVGLVGGGAEGWLRREQKLTGEVVPVAGVPEGGEEVAGKLLRGDVVLLVPWAGAEGLCRGESTVRPSGGGA